MILTPTLFSIPGLALLGAAAVSHGNPQPGPSPIPASVRAICMAQVGMVVKLPIGTSYALTFDSLDGKDGAVSGTVALYSGNQRYELTFPATVAGDARSADKRAPLVVRFPAPVKIDSAVLTSISGPEGGPCLPVVAHQVEPSRWWALSQDALFARAARTAPVDAPSPEVLPASECRVPSRTAHLKVSVPTPRLATTDLETGSALVEVEVVVDDTGNAMNATVMHSSLNSAMDDAALYAAARSTYEPETFRCQNVGGYYKFIAEFAR